MNRRQQQLSALLWNSVNAMPTPQVQSVGRSIFDPVWAVKEHAGRHTEIIHIIRGRVKVRTPDYTIAGSEGDTIYTPTGQPHRDCFPLGSEFEVFLVFVDWPGESHLLSQYSPPDLARANPQLRALMTSDFQRLYDDFLVGGSLAQELVNLRMKRILFNLLRSAGGDYPGADAAQTSRRRRTDIMTQARRVIHQRYTQALSLEDIASALDISTYYLSRVFSQETGFTLSSYISWVRMQKAAELLRAGVDKVSAVAWHVGYRDSHYFTRVFKLHWGMTPAQYRRQAPRD